MNLRDAFEEGLIRGKRSKSLKQISLSLDEYTDDIKDFVFDEIIKLTNEINEYRSALGEESRDVSKLPKRSKGAD